MAELSVQERLLPSLLDRLEDNEREKTAESRDRRTLTSQQIQDRVKRDLEWLMNAANLGAQLDADAFPHVARSVLNYGLPPLSGLSLNASDVAELERRLYDAIRNFEPRILPGTLQVGLALKSAQHDHRALTFDIAGEMWAQPIPIRLFLRTEVDLDVGAVKVTDNAGYR